MSAAQPAGTSNDAANPVAGLIDRLCALIAEETAALTAGRQFDLEQLNRRKNHAVLELRQLSEALHGHRGDDPELRERLARLQRLLHENERVLQHHLTAARQIATILGQAVAEQDSDGTYSPSAAIGRVS